MYLLCNRKIKCMKNAAALIEKTVALLVFLLHYRFSVAMHKNRGVILSIYAEKNLFEILHYKNICDKILKCTKFHIHKLGRND